MGEKKENVVRYGGATVKLYQRGNGAVAVSWSEGGKAMRSTRATWEKATRWAERKVRELDTASGQRWITPAAADRLAWLESLAGGPEAAGQLLTMLEEAKKAMGGTLSDLTTAAAWYVKHGPPAVNHRLLADAAAAFLAEYEAHHPDVTVRPIRNELTTFLAAHPSIDFLEVSHHQLAKHVARTIDGEPPATRTLRNRINAWRTFYNRCEALEWWPEGKKHPAAKLKLPRMEDRAPEIFTPETGKALLQLVKDKAPQHLPFVLIAGWLGCRPSECRRLLRADFDFKQRVLHVRAAVARKKKQERWTPISSELAAILQACFKADADGRMGVARKGQRGNHLKAIRHNSQEIVSALAREHGIIAEWQPDVLRHSFITYRLQQTKNIEDTAEEAGNSPAEIRRSYKRPIPAGEWKKWQAALQAATASRTSA